MVAIDIAQEFFSSDRVWMFIAASRELLGTHLALNLQLTGKALLVKDSVLIIENRHRAASVFDANVGRPAQDPAPRSYEDYGWLLSRDLASRRPCRPRDSRR